MRNILLSSQHVGGQAQHVARGGGEVDRQSHPKRQAWCQDWFQTGETSHSLIQLNFKRRGSRQTRLLIRVIIHPLQFYLHLSDWKRDERVRMRQVVIFEASKSATLFSQGHVVMGNNAVSPYQQVIEKTKSLSFRSQMLAMNIEKKVAHSNRNEVSWEPEGSILFQKRVIHRGF